MDQGETMAKKSGENTKPPAKKGAAELTEDQLDDVSGGPHITTVDGLKVKPDRLPGGAVRNNKI